MDKGQRKVRDSWAAKPDLMRVQGDAVRPSAGHAQDAIPRFVPEACKRISCGFCLPVPYGAAGSVIGLRLVREE